MDNLPVYDQLPKAYYQTWPNTGRAECSNKNLTMLIFAVKNSMSHTNSSDYAMHENEFWFYDKDI